MSVIKKHISFIIIFLFVSTNNVYSDNLNILFKELLNAKNLQQAEKLEDQIWNKWTRHPNNDYLTNKLENGTYSMYHQQYRMALKLFTDVINEDPKWAEGWNKRATLLFILGDYEKSLEDIEKVLDLEPRHFGALSGRAQIYLSLKEYEKAVDDLRKAKSIYPLIKSGENIKLIEKIIKDQQIYLFLDLFFAISCVNESTIKSEALKISLGLNSCEIFFSSFVLSSMTIPSSGELFLI